MDGLELSEDLQVEEALSALSFTGAPIDPGRPGFASLLTALRAYGEGRLEPDVLALYHASLSVQLEASRQRLLELEPPDSFPESVGQALAATREVMGRMEWVLHHLGALLGGGQEDSLAEATRILEGIHEELEQVLQQGR